MRYRFGGFALDDKRFALTGPDGAVHVEPQVFELLHHLIRNHDRVVTKEELLDEIWGDRFVSESALTSRVKAARRAVGDDGQAQGVIKTVHGRGYQFVAALRADAGSGSSRAALPRLRNVPIGRDVDIARVAERVGDAPMVTITGSGGIGKTTVALAVAERLQDGYADGAVFVDLSPVPPGADVTRAVAEAAGVEGAASETIERVASHLAHRPVLLVLDNCEHVLDRSSELVDRMLQQGGTAHVLATSREPLAVGGEHVWPLGPLHEAGPALFVERARAAEPRVTWDPADPAVTELCRRLDGVPLAIELAAGQLRRFDLAELTRHLDDRLAMLAGRTAGGSPRHGTMETAIDWSYRLLDGDEQRLLRQLSVFPASFDLRAVEASAPPLERSDPVAAFGQLVDKSLVVRQPGSGRYRLLETIRMFARDRLGECGEAASAFERHRALVCGRVAASSRLDRWLSARLAAAFRTDLEDARQAFRLSIAQGHARDALEVAIGASFLWRNSLGCTEGDAWTDELLGLDLSIEDQMWAYILRADVGEGRGDHRQMFGAAADGAGLIGRVDDPGGACVASHFAALAHLTEPEPARAHLAETLDLARRSGDSRLVTLIEVFLAVAAIGAGRPEDDDETRAALSRLRGASSEDGYDSFILHWAGWMLALAEQDAPAARAWMEEQQDFLDRTGIVETWITSFSTVMCEAVEGADVRPGLARTLALADREGYRADADCVLALAYAELCAGRTEEAAALVGTAMHGRFNATAHYVLYRNVLDRSLRQRLDPRALAAAMAQGRDQPAEEALAAYGVRRP